MKRPALAKVGALVVATGCLTSVAFAEASPSTNSISGSGRTADAWQLTRDSTASRDWHYVDLGQILTPSAGYNVRSVGLVTAAVSMTLFGAPAQIRWVDNGHVEPPRLLTFAPRSNDDAFSYTFYDYGKRLPCGHTLRLLWRSPSGHQVHLESGDVVVTYQPATNDNQPCT